MRALVSRTEWSSYKRKDKISEEKREVRKVNERLNETWSWMTIVSLNMVLMGFLGGGWKSWSSFNLNRLSSSLGKPTTNSPFALALHFMLNHTLVPVKYGADTLFCVGYRGTVLVLCLFGIEIYSRISPKYRWASTRPGYTSVDKLFTSTPTFGSSITFSIGEWKGELMIFFTSSIAHSLKRCNFNPVISDIITEHRFFSLVHEIWDRIGIGIVDYVMTSTPPMKTEDNEVNSIRLWLWLACKDRTFNCQPLTIWGYPNDKNELLHLEHWIESSWHQFLRNSWFLIPESSLMGWMQLKRMELNSSNQNPVSDFMSWLDSPTNDEGVAVASRSLSNRVKYHWLHFTYGCTYIQYIFFTPAPL